MPIQIGNKINLWNNDTPSLVQKIDNKIISENWNRISITANFIADFHTPCFQNPKAHNLISTLINELIENASKYCSPEHSTITLKSGSHERYFFFEITNFIENSIEFQSICKHLFEGNLKEKYLQRLMEINDKQTHHGIGLMLIIKDFQSALSFSFDQIDNKDFASVAIEINVEDYLCE